MRPTHKAEHRDSRVGQGYRGIAAFMESVVRAFAWLAVIVYDGRASLFHVERGAKTVLYGYFADLKRAGFIKSKVFITLLPTGRG